MTPIARLIVPKTAQRIAPQTDGVLAQMLQADGLEIDQMIVLEGNTLALGAVLEGNTLALGAVLEGSILGSEGSVLALVTALEEKLVLEENTLALGIVQRMELVLEGNSPGLVAVSETL
jgi:hypothetical protein